ncbi:MAG TPA: hypothetical protein VGO47_00355 [Chlamydiales bacterium]|nr:hypothetical protein [Chlamydiales bacterium]
MTAQAFVYESGFYEVVPLKLNRIEKQQLGHSIESYHVQQVMRILHEWLEFFYPVLAGLPLRAAVNVYSGSQWQ